MTGLTTLLIIPQMALQYCIGLSKNKELLNPMSLQVDLTKAAVGLLLFLLLPLGIIVSPCLSRLVREAILQAGPLSSLCNI